MPTTDSDAPKPGFNLGGTAAYRMYARSFVAQYQERAIDITKAFITFTNTCKSQRKAVATFASQQFQRTQRFYQVMWHEVVRPTLTTLPVVGKPFAARAAAPAMRSYVLLLGAPGAGKGTQAKAITTALDLAHVSSGDLFRDNIKLGTELGLLAKSFIDRGELVPDKVTIDMVMDVLCQPENAKGALLDGFPRTIPQAHALDVALAQNFGSRVGKVIYIKVETEELLNRLSGRWLCPVDGAIYHEVTRPPKVAGVCDNDSATLTQRPDDSRATGQHRLSVYFNQTAPLLEYYRRAGALVEIDGQQPVSQVTASIIGTLKL